jgi:hypothetical protein
MLPFYGNYGKSQTFQEHIDAKKANGWQFYNGGDDYLTPNETEILASEKGFVKYFGTDSSPSGGYGNYIILDHGDGLETLYAHLSRIYVEKIGQEVQQGELIGLSGNTGNSTGPHLHFEMRLNNIPVDPELYLNTEIQVNPVVEEKLKKDDIALIMSDVGANIRNPNGEKIGWVDYNQEIYIIGDAQIMNELEYYPVYIMGYIAKKDKLGNIILEKK